MLKIISANVNGIRSAYKKGFYEYIAASGADIVCVQELKAQEADLSDDMKNPHGMHGYWHCAEKRGYSGVAVYSKRKPDNVQIGMGIEEFDREGRQVVGNFAISAQRQQRGRAPTSEIPLFRRVLSHARSHEK